MNRKTIVIYVNSEKKINWKGILYHHRVLDGRMQISKE